MHSENKINTAPKRDSLNLEGSSKRMLLTATSPNLGIRRVMRVIFIYCVQLSSVKEECEQSLLDKNNVFDRILVLYYQSRTKLVAIANI